MKKFLWILFGFLVILVTIMGVLNYLLLAEAPKPLIIEPSPDLKIEKEALKPIEPTFSFISKMDTTDTPHTKIFLDLGDHKVFLTEETAAFGMIEKQYFTSLNIPTTAKAACKGFWAGLEQTYIVQDSARQWVVKRRMIDESSGKNEPFEDVKKVNY